MPNNTEELIGGIEVALSSFDRSTVKVQNKYWDELLDGVLSLDYDKNRQIISSTKNLKTVTEIKGSLNSFLQSPQNTSHVKKFSKTYSELEKINNEYFAGMVEDFGVPSGLKVVKDSSLISLADSLVGAGVNGAVTSRVYDILNQNLTSGTTRSQLIRQLQDFTLGKKGELGALHRYSKQIATDSINQFNASYNSAVTKSLGFTWYRYVGRLKDTSRPFCRAAISQRYFHVSELSAAATGRLAVGQVSTAGMVSGTNSHNILTYRGGYNCNHQFRGVTTRSVPASAKARIRGEVPLEAEDRLDKQIAISSKGKDANSLNLQRKAITQYQDGDAFMNNSLLRDKQFYTESGKKVTLKDMPQYELERISDDIAKVDNFIKDKGTKTNSMLYRGDRSNFMSEAYKKTGIGKELKNFDVSTQKDLISVKPPSGNNWDEYFTKKLKGYEYTDKGFTSTSYKESVALDPNFVEAGNISDYPSGNKWNVNTKNLKALDMDKVAKDGFDQAEFLLPRGTTFKVKRVRVKEYSRFNSGEFDGFILDIDMDIVD
jgi:hypothetical protein